MTIISGLGDVLANKSNNMMCSYFVKTLQLLVQNIGSSFRVIQGFDIYIED